MNIKKFLIILIAILICSVPVLANALSEDVNSVYESFDFSSVFQNMDHTLKEYLENIGITEVSFKNIFSLNPNKIFDLIFEIASGKLNEPLKYFFIGLGIMSVTAIFMNISQSTELTMLIGSSCASCVLALPVIECINTAFSVLNTLTGLTTSLSAVLCAIISAGGGAVTGASYYAINMSVNSVLNIIISTVSSPLINGMCALAFLSCFNRENFSERVSELFKKIYIFLLSLIGTVFSAVSGIKTVLGSSADSVASKSIKFLVGRSLPIVGGAVSESYQNIISSFLLIKNTAGVFGIVTVAIAVLPIVIELLLWCISFNFLILAAELFNLYKIQGILIIFKDVTLLLIATVLFSAMLFVISTGLLLFFKSGI